MIIVVIQWLLGAFELVSGIFYNDSSHVEVFPLNGTLLSIPISSNKITHYK